MRTKDEIYRIFYLIDFLKKEYLESEAEPNDKKLEELAEAITKNENTRDLNDKRDKGISAKTLKRFFNFKNNPWGISERKLNHITRYIKGEFVAEFSSTSFVNEIKEDLNTFKENKKKELDAIFDKFKKYEAPNSSGGEVKYRFNIGTEKPDLNALNKIPFLEYLIHELEERMDILEDEGIREVFTEKQIRQIKNYFVMWSEDKIANICWNYLDKELQKTNKKYNRAIRLNRYLGSLGLIFITVDKSKDWISAIFEKFEFWLSQVFQEEYATAIEYMENEETETENNDEDNSLDEESDL